MRAQMRAQILAQILAQISERELGKMGLFVGYSAGKRSINLP